ncbi:uncharacterized protein G2W53_027453 [Senna tora]|uniref:Uncharacterized protein n=1 Tax=Senna tora TaxID=362788 RepID=A0A834TGX8_9FABA|nr:uncharacterized protein G2W53_027453 [Senna tora]
MALHWAFWTPRQAAKVAYMGLTPHFVC